MQEQKTMRKKPKKLLFDKTTKVIEITDLNLAQKDLIRIKEKKDFMELVGKQNLVFKYEKMYYLLQDTVGYEYMDGGQ